MSRGTFVYREGRLVPKSLAAPLPRGPRSDAIAAPYLAPDAMSPTRSMLDGKIYESKAALRSTYRAAGVREIGNETEAAVKDAYARVSHKPSVHQEIADAYRMVKQGYKPAPLARDPDLD